MRPWLSFDYLFELFFSVLSKISETFLVLLIFMKKSKKRNIYNCDGTFLKLLFEKIYARQT